MSFAFTFPGQGSQSVGMLQAFSSQPQVQQTFAEASEVLSIDLWRLCQQGPEEELNRTINAQPALLTAGVALWRLWCSRTEQTPSFMAGHSLGEYTALVCANSVKFSDAVGLVRQRGKYMQMAVADGEGAMAAIIGLNSEEVSDICNDIVKEGYVQPANINSPQQIVVSGYAQAVENLIKEARTRGAGKAVLLPVSVPSHCALMQSAADLLSVDMDNLSMQLPRITILHNVDAQEGKDSAEMKSKLIQQLIYPVQWIKTIEAMKERGVDRIVECGPGKILSGLNRAIDKDLEVFSLGRDIDAFEETLNEVAA